MNHKKGVAFAILTALLWGFLAILIKIVLKKVDAVAVVWVRMTIAMLGVAVYFLMKNPSSLSILVRPPRLLWVAAIALSVNYVGYAFGIQLAGPATAQVVVQFGPVALCLFGIFIFKERFVLRQILGFVLAFCGLFFFYRQQLSAVEFGRDDFIKGVICTGVAALAWSLYSISQKKLVKKYSVQQINLFLYAFASLVYLPFVDFSMFRGLSVMMWVALVVLGLNTLVAYGAVGAALKYTDAGKVSVILILNPLITFVALGIMEAMGVDWFVLEKIPFWAYVGAGMMLCGAIMAVVTPMRKKLSKKAEDDEFRKGVEV